MDNNHSVRLGIAPQGFSTFLVLWIGQTVSSIGSRLSEFALGVWVYQQTHSATQFSLVYLSLFLPELVVAPFCGVFVDRCDRRWLMLMSTVGAGLSTLAIALLLGLGQLEIWGICMILACRALFTTFHLQTYVTLPRLLVPLKHLGRASGMMQLARATAEILAPMMASLLLAAVQIEGIVWIDAASFMVAILTLWIVRLPALPPKQVGQPQPCFWQEMRLGWGYIMQQQGLRSLMLFFLLPYFTLGCLWVLFQPLVLSFASSMQLGLVMSIGGLGWLLGSLYMSIGGGPPSKVAGIWVAVLGQGIFLLLGGLQPSVRLAAVGIFGYLFAYPIALSCAQALWQSLVAPELQGRVFGVRHLLEQLPMAVALIVAGPLAEQLFEPAMAADGWLSGTVGSVIGVGDGRGIGLCFLLLGICNGLAALLLWRHAPTRSLTC